jgi:hypothetical protein
MQVLNIVGQVFFFREISELIGRALEKREKEKKEPAEDRASNDSGEQAETEVPSVVETSAGRLVDAGSQHRWPSFLLQGDLRAHRAGLARCLLPASTRRPADGLYSKLSLASP